jgi:hypothetical protein
MNEWDSRFRGNDGNTKSNWVQQASRDKTSVTAGSATPGPAETKTNILRMMLLLVMAIPYLILSIKRSPSRFYSCRSTGLYILFATHKRLMAVACFENCHPILLSCFLSGILFAPIGCILQKILFFVGLKGVSGTNRCGYPHSV